MTQPASTRKESLVVTLLLMDLGAEGCRLRVVCGIIACGVLYNLYVNTNG